jgi:peptidyl-prolyl cis-trans isomerase D
MIEFFRTKVKDSIFLKILMGIVMLSFGVWGVGDFIGTGNLDPSIAVKVGKAEIRTDEFSRRYTQELERFKQSMGPAATAEEAFRRSIAQALIQDITRTATVNAAGRAMDVVIPPDTLRTSIREEKAFADQTGQFSQTQFAQALAQANITERGFVDMVEQDLRQQRMIRPIAANTGAPKALSDALFGYRTESRVAETLLITAPTLALTKAPTEEDIKAVYDQNLATFTAPEYRKLSAVILSAKDMVKPDSLEDADLKTFYDQNAARYRTPAKRHVVQVVFDSEEKAASAKAAAKPGESLSSLAARVNAGPVIDMGDLATDSPIAKTIAVAFVLPANEISPPVQTDLGWHLLEVTAITPETVKSFDDVKDAVRVAVAADKGVTAMYDASVQLEDQVAAGAPLPDAAKAVNGRLVTIQAMDRDGKTPFGAEIGDLFDRANFLRLAFSLQKGADSGLKETATRDGYYVVKVDDIMAPSPKPFADVKAQATLMWEKQQREAMAKDIAAKVRAQITPATALNTLEAGDKRLSYAQLGPVTRFGESPQQGAVVDTRRISPELLEPLFAAKVGDVVSAPVLDGIVVARLKEIRPAQTADPASGYGQMVDALKSSIGNDLMDQFTRAFGKRYAVEVNHTVVDDLVARAR